MGLTTDPNDAGLRQLRADGQQEVYLVLSEEERARGFVRPVRERYRHVGCRPQGPTRSLTPEEQDRYSACHYVCYEAYNPPHGAVTGRFWTEKQLTSGCNQVTTMGRALAETYSRNPKFYSGTFCVHCGQHFPVGLGGEFVWEPDGEPVGSDAEEAALFQESRRLRAAAKQQGAGI